MAEHGHNLIACDLEGNKLWGRQLDGWTGPSALFAGRDTLLAQVKNTIWRIDPQTFDCERLLDTGGNPIRVAGAGPDRLHLILDNRAARIHPFAFAIRHEDIAFKDATPQKLGSSAPDYQLAPERQFSTVFASHGGHFQTGFPAAVRNGVGHVIVPWRDDREIGSVVLLQPPTVARAVVYLLNPGLSYDPMRHSPLDASTEAAPELLDLEADAAAPHWTLFATTDFDTPLVVLPAPRPGMKTSALHIRLLPAPGKVAGFKPHLTLCRIMARRLEAVPLKLLEISLGDQREPVPPGAPAGWKLSAPEKISAAAPATIVLGTPERTAVDGLLFLNHTSTAYQVAGADSTRPEPWQPLAEYRAHASRKNGFATASTLARTDFVAFADRILADRLRLTVSAAFGRGRVGLSWQEEDPRQLDCQQVVGLRALDPLPKPAPHIYRTHWLDGSDAGDLLEGDFATITQLTEAADGRLYGVAADRLCLATVEGASLATRSISGQDLAGAANLQVVDGEIVVGLPSAVLFFSPDGKLLRRLGSGGYRRGPWEADRLGKCSGVAIDANRKVWIAEAAYSPKRISRFNLDGQCELEFFGPPAYGGGGWLDPNLRSFYYRGMEFAIDWQAGTSRLKALNDRQYDPASPAMDASSFAYTQIGRPLYLHGRRYVVGDPGSQFSPGVVVCLLEGDSWRPCAVMGSAKGNRFLFAAEKPWREHWLAQEVDDSLFIWNDHNGDGDYQIEEVDLFKRDSVPGQPFAGAYWGSWLGPDLSIWSHSGRLAPHRFSEAGVPIYRRQDIQPFDYAKLAPFYTRMQSFGSRAVPGPGNASIVCADGSLIICGQPYRVMPDGQLFGGPPLGAPSDYLPSVNGLLIDQPLHYAGTAVTASAVGEVAVHVGNSGVWSVVAVRDRILLDRIFTGADGGWNSDLPARRGVDVTGRRHDWETFFGHFVKGDDGNYYVVAGKGFHAICRIEGLDEYRIASLAVQVTEETLAANRELRRRTVAQLAADQKAKARQRLNPTARLRRRADLGHHFKVDGLVDEWAAMTPVDGATTPDAPPPTAWFAAAADPDALYLALRGHSHLGSQAADPHYLFRAGFAIDFHYRLDLGNETATVTPGDRRIVFGRQQGQWLAMLYDYLTSDAEKPRRRHFESPVETTTVDDVRPLPLQPEAPDGATIRFVEDDTGWLTDDGDLPGRPGQPWTAEIRLPWAVLGFPKAPSRLRCDIGLMLPDTDGIKVERQLRWAHPGPLTVSDAAAEARIEPGKWGTLTCDE